MPPTLVVRHGDLTIDLVRYRVLLDEAPIMLTYREYALLVMLAMRAGHPVSKRRLLEEGMGRHDVGGLRMVDEHVRHLKLTLERDGGTFIEEVPGVGYRFVPQGNREGAYR